MGVQGNIGLDSSIESALLLRAQDALASSKVEKATQGLNAAKTPDKSKEQLKSLSKEFESIVVQMMLKSMRDTVPQGDDLLGEGSNQVDTYRSLLDEEYSKKISERGGFGLSDMLYRQLMQQEGLQNDSPQNVKPIGAKRENQR
jgi:peptidoglycan hydrolase FlgJ